MGLFPLIDLPSLAAEGQTARPLFREVGWDFKTNRPLWRGGEPVYCTGAQAVLVWAWLALQTELRMHDVFTRDYGLGIRSELMGKPFTQSVQHAEAIRYVKEALMINPYITDVTAVEVSFHGSELTVECTIKTVYGEVALSAERSTVTAARPVNPTPPDPCNHEEMTAEEIARMWAEIMGQTEPADEEE